MGNCLLTTRNIGLCTVLNGNRYQDLFSKPTYMTTLLSTFFNMGISNKETPLTMSTTFGRKVLLLLDVHNEAITQSKGLGSVHISIGPREAYIFQVTLH